MEDRKASIPMEVVDTDGNICSDIKVVLNKWKSDYSALLNQRDLNTCMSNFSSHADTGLQTKDTFNDFLLTEPISYQETLHAVETAKKGKSAGFDNLPVEAFLNKCSALFLFHMFDFCFKFGKTPDIWNKIINNPIPKSKMADHRDPLSYRGIALASVSYKLYCNILNDRLTQWVDDNDLLADEQNGFRKQRSTVDQLSTLTNIIDVRKRLKKSTFCAFIDFKKAYDTINRDVLWKKNLGILVWQKICVMLLNQFIQMSCVQLE